MPIYLQKSFAFWIQRGIYVAGLREEIVNCSQQVIELLELGEGLENELSKLNHQSMVFVGEYHILVAANRHFGETNMNTRSSRSHTIFRMVWNLSLFFCYYFFSGYYYLPFPLHSK